MLLEDFDEDRALIAPEVVGCAWLTPVHVMPEVVLCPFSGPLIDQLKAQGRLTPIAYLSSINGRELIYRYEAEGRAFAVIMPRVGGPMAVGMLEELYGAGARQFVVFGSCGVLASALAADTLIIPNRALRDEGTSYHYVPSQPAIAASAAAVALLRRVFGAAGLAWDTATTWTTDAFYRETGARKARMQALGATVVDMEAASLMAWAQYRQVGLYQFFYTADHVAQAGWDERKAARTLPLTAFFDLAVQVGLAIA